MRVILILIGLISHSLILSEETEVSIELKMKSLIIPSLTIDELPIGEALEKIALSSSALDFDLVIVQTSAPPKTAKLSLRGTQLSVWEFVRKSATRSGLTLKANRDYLSITDKKGKTYLAVIPKNGHSQKDRYKLPADIKLANSLKQTLIQKLEFHETPLKDALDFLCQKSVELNHPDFDPNEKGVGIILSKSKLNPSKEAPAGFDDGEFGFEGQNGGSAAVPFRKKTSHTITLRCENITIWDALRCTTLAMDLKFEFKNGVGVIRPINGESKSVE